MSLSLGCRPPVFLVGQPLFGLTRGQTTLVLHTSVPEPWGIRTVPLTLRISLSRREERLCALQSLFCPVFSLIHIVMSGDKMLLCFSRMKKRNLGAQAGSWHPSSFFKLLDQNSSVCKWDLLLCFKGSGTAGKTGSLGKKPGKWQTLMIIFSMFLM